MKQADLRNMFRKSSKSICTSNVVISPDKALISYSLTSAVMTPVNTEDPDDPEPAAQGDTQIEYCSNESYSPMYRSRNKKLQVRTLDQYKYCLII